MEPPRPSRERRIFPRHRVRVAVVWQNRVEQLMPGEICDVSAQGLFLVATSALPDQVGVGDRTQIALCVEGREEVLVGVVRWRGFHPIHEAIGCGIQLDEASVKTADRIFPILCQSPPKPVQRRRTPAPTS